jgi:hypothetical protein
LLSLLLPWVDAAKDNDLLAATGLEVQGRSVALDAQADDHTVRFPFVDGGISETIGFYLHPSFTEIDEGGADATCLPAATT